MQYRTFLPHPELRPYIENYWQLGLHNDAGQPLESCIVPDGNASLMFIQHPLQRRNTAYSQTEKYSDHCLLVGQKTRAVFYSFPPEKWVQTFGVRFRPLGLAAFLNISQRELRDQSVNAADLFGPEIRYLANQLQEAPDSGFNLDLLNIFFLKRLRHPPPRFLLINKLLQFIFTSKGQLKMVHLQSLSSISYRQMDRLFQFYLGLSPKTYARIIRFNHCIFLQRSHYYEKLTDLAYSGGYFDQMHFIKEIKHFTHQTPKQYFLHSGQMGPALNDLLSQRFSTGVI